MNQESFALHGVIIWEPFENYKPLFVPEEALHGFGTGIPDAVRVRVDCFENIEKVLGIHILRCYPS